MQFQSVKRSETFFYNDFLQDYLEGKGLDVLRTYAPKKESILEAIKGKENFSVAQRNLLADDLQSQYEESDIDISDTLVSSNIAKLRDENSFTITTGQQIHIGLGPLYVLYKIFDVVANATRLSKEYPSYNFIPVFWMASEDHDLDEIREIPIFGKNFYWETEQRGAVGRMNPDGISELFQRLKDEFRFSDDQLAFIDYCQGAYAESDSLSIAFRKILHRYFKSNGLVIIDADRKSLKNSFTSVLNDELAHRNYEALTTSTEKLEKIGYKRPLVIRECNLFKIHKNERSKITGRSDNPAITAEEAYNFSPNAALRPFYQEWILPNIMYVGGQSEVKYWMQLKGLFDNYKMPMPIVQLRTSVVLAPEKQVISSGIDNISTFFKSDSELSDSLDDEFRVLNESLAGAHEDIEKAIVRYSELVKKRFKGFSLEGKINKIIPKVYELKTLMSNQLVFEFKSEQKVQKALKIKTKYFNENNVQERTEHVLSHVHLLRNNEISVSLMFGFENQQVINIIFL